MKWTLTESPQFHHNLEDLIQTHHANEKLNPWINNQPYLLANVALIKENNEWLLIDESKSVIPINQSFDERKAMNWLLLSGGGKVDIAAVHRGDSLLPLGIFSHNKYQSL